MRIPLYSRYYYNICAGSGARILSGGPQVVKKELFVHETIVEYLDI